MDIKDNKDFINPIDKDKITENPSTLPYAHSVGGPVIKPVDRGKIKSRALTSMYEQTDMQMSQIYKQMELLAEQAKKIQARKDISELIFEAAIGFEPLIGMIYHLYQRENEEYLLSLVAPEEWGKSMPFKRFCAKVRMLADHTWDILEGGF